MTLDHTYGGALRKECPWYVERPADQLVFDHLARGGNGYVLTSHQMGKSSLIVRLAEKLRQANLLTVVVDLAAIGCELTEDQWYYALAHRIGRQLHLEEALDRFWSLRQDWPPFRTFAEALGQIAFSHRPARLVVFIDEVDLLGSLPFSPDEFLHLVQQSALDSPGSEVPSLQIGFCLLGTAAPSELWRNPSPSSTGLGRVFRLRDFTRDDLTRLGARLAQELHQIPGVEWRDQLHAPEFLVERVLERVFYWTRGHPYLTQILSSAATCQVVEQLRQGIEFLAGQSSDLVDHCCYLLFTSPAARESDAHLLWIQHHLSRSDTSAEQILDSHRLDLGNPRETTASPTAPQRWRTSGIVRFRNGRIEWRNRIYERAFARRRTPSGRGRPPGRCRKPAPVEPDPPDAAERLTSRFAPILPSAAAV